MGPADYVVTGALIPDATGAYYQAGIANGYPVYARADGDFILKHEISTSAWDIQEHPLGPDAISWTKLGNDPTGVYVPGPTCSGDATVSAGP